MDALAETITAILWSHKAKGTDLDAPRLAKLVVDEFDLLSMKHDWEEAEIAAAIQDQATRRDIGRDMASSEKDWERWLEFDRDIGDTSAHDIQEAIPVLVRHRALEFQLASRFQQWGYEVETGKKLESDEGIEYVADVHASLQNLHGQFEVFVNFVCDEGASPYRASYLLSAIEDYAERDDTTFNGGDVFFLVTPFEFADQTVKQAKKLLEDREYITVLLDGDDVNYLKKSGAEEVQAYLMDKVDAKREIQQLAKRGLRSHR